MGTVILLINMIEFRKISPCLRLDCPPLPFFLLLCYIDYRGNKMGTRVKPVQATEIKDKKIVYQVIQEVRRKPTAAALKRHKAEEEAFVRLLKK